MINARDNQNISTNMMRTSFIVTIGMQPIDQSKHNHSGQNNSHKFRLKM